MAGAIIANLWLQLLFVLAVLRKWTQSRLQSAPINTKRTSDSTLETSIYFMFYTLASYFAILDCAPACHFQCRTSDGQGAGIRCMLHANCSTTPQSRPRRHNRQEAHRHAEDRVEPGRQVVRISWILHAQPVQNRSPC